MTSDVIGTCLSAFSLHSAASRTRLTISSLGVTSEIFNFGNSGDRSRIVKATSASGSAAGASSGVALGSASASMRCGLNGGSPAVRSVADSARLAPTRTNGRTRTTSWLPERDVVETRMTWRATLGSSAGGRRSALRAPSLSLAAPSAPRNATSTRSGSEAKLASPSSEVNTAPPIRAAPHRAVRIVPANHCTETRRRSTKPLLPPSTDSGGSLPSSSISATLDRWAPRSRVCSNPRPLARSIVGGCRIWLPHPSAAKSSGTMPGAPTRVNHADGSR